MTDLLGCPFCGGEAEIDTQQAYRNITTGRVESAVAVYCSKCGAQHTICRGDVPDVQPGEVVDLWNRRAALATVEAQPVAFLTVRGDERRVVLAEFMSPGEAAKGSNGWSVVPLYAHPPAAQAEAVGEISSLQKQFDRADEFDQHGGEHPLLGTSGFKGMGK